MPILNWIGKEKVINHHQEVPFKVLDQQYVFNEEQTSENKIIHGDNLEALKALLPEYEGKIKCIYIDPPYNTGNESWVYNDNVNHPKIKKWLGQVVGKESEDLTRHDKWLCMMYPRLKLLHKLLSDDGAIFISIDDNEQANLKLICDEVFGINNYLTSFIWKKAAGSQNDAKYVAISHEYVLGYSKDKSKIGLQNLPLPIETVKAYKFEDEYLNTRGKYQLRNLNDFSTGDRPGLHHDIICPDGSILDGKLFRWRCDKKKFDKRLNENRIVFKKEDNQWQVYYKLYLNEEKEELNYDSEGNIIQRGVTPNSVLEKVGFTSEGGKILKEIFQEKIFDYPKPKNLIEYFVQLISNKNSIILDSFAGSGTTAHAVLNLNKQDGGNRKFILIEMEDYAESITAERVKRVINGYADKEGTGGSFTYYKLGQPLFIGDNSEYINEAVGIEKIRQYIWYSETRTAFAEDAATNSANEFFLGKKDTTAYYFIYQKDALTTLDYETLATINVKAESYVVYADNCLLPKEFMLQHNIVFKKIPRDITRF